MMFVLNMLDPVYLDVVLNIYLFFMNIFSSLSFVTILVIFSILSSIFLASKGDKIIRNIGCLGTGSFCGIGAVYSRVSRIKANIVVF
jgi:hypothetical protein